MAFTVIEHAGLAFATVFALQVLLARAYRPVSEDKFIILLYVIAPFFIFLGLWWWGGIPDVVLSYLLFFVLASSWVGSYPAVYGVCPSLFISYLVHASPNGISLPEMREVFDLKQNSLNRIEDAIHDRWIERHGADVRLTASGRFFAAAFRVFRRVLGLGMETQ